MEDERPLLTSGPSGEDKIFASLSYVSILFIIPLILKHDDDYVYFHARQGMVLFLAEVVVWFALFMLESFMVARAPRATVDLLGYRGNIAWGLVFGVWIFGINFALIGRKWEMPLLGRIAKGLNI